MQDAHRLIHAAGRMAPNEGLQDGAPRPTVHISSSILSVSPKNQTRLISITS